MERDDLGGPTRSQRVVAVSGLVAIVLVAPVTVGIFGAAALRWVLTVGAAAAILIGVGVAVRYVISRKFPVLAFELSDVSEPAARLEDAQARLAAGDYAAFAVYADGGEAKSEASGQIWLYAAKGGGIERTAIELAYDSLTAPRRHPALAALVDDGWQITGWERSQWVLLGRDGGVDAAETIVVVARAAAALAGIGEGNGWSFRAIA